MSRYKNLCFDGFPSAATMAGAKGKAGVLNTSNQIAVAGAAAAMNPGYVIADDTATAAGTMTKVGVLAPGARFEAQIGETVAIGDKLTPAADGQFVLATSGDPVWAQAMAAGADGDTIEAVAASGVALA